MADGGNIERRIDVFRSSIAAQYIQGMTHAEDMRRPVTSDGIQLAKKRQVALGYPRYDIALFSPALRCMYTAGEIGELSEIPVFLEVPELCYPAKDTPEGTALAKLFSQLGDANLRAYDHDDPGNVIENHAHTAWDKVWETIVECGSKRTLVVGHNVLINAMGFIAAFDIEDQYSKRCNMFETVTLGKCEGYSLYLTDRTVVKVELHQATTELF
jgi:broad specificity phosphatase PhoE